MTKLNAANIRELKELTPTQRFTYKEMLTRVDSDLIYVGTIRELVDIVGVTETHLSKVVRRLVEVGLLTRLGYGKYRVCLP